MFSGTSVAGSNVRISTYDIESMLVTVRMLAGGTDSNPIQHQRRPDRPRTLLVAPVGDEGMLRPTDSLSSADDDSI